LHSYYPSPQKKKKIILLGLCLLLFVISELGEGWGENKEPIKEGVTFYLKYLGSTLVEELTKEGDSYGEGASSGAVKRVVAMVGIQRIY
jgi:hypothetical protein